MSKLEIIILHGWAIDPHNETKWEALRSQLEKKGIHTTFLPIPGMDTQLKEPWSLSDYVTWLEGELKHRKKSILLGHSFGGQLAIRYAVTHPKTIEKLILIAPAGIRDNSLPAILKRNIFFFLAKVGKKVFKHPFCKRVLYALAREHDYEHAPESMKKTMSLVTKDEIRKDIFNLTLPVQLIWGKKDTSTPFSNSRLFTKVLKNVHLCSIEEARHSPQFTHTKKVAECISTFLQSDTLS